MANLICFQNLRGINRREKWALFKREVKKSGTNIVAILETRRAQPVDDRHGPWGLINNTNSIQVPADGFSGGLLILWNPDKVTISNHIESTRWVAIELVWPDIPFTGYVLFIYAPVQADARRSMYSEIMGLNLNKPILVAGDMNEV